MTADAVIADWVPWSTGDAARYRTKAEAVVDLRYRLREAGFVIVPSEPSQGMLLACEAAIADGSMTDTRVLLSGAWTAMIKESQR